MTKGLATIPLSSACTLGWVSQVAKCEGLVSEQRCPIFCVLCLYLASAHDFGDAGKVKLVAEAIHHHARTTSSEVTLDRLDRFHWVEKLCDGRLYLQAVPEMLKYVAYEELYGEDNSDREDRELETKDEGGLQLPATEPSQFIVDVASFILPYANKTVLAQRRVTIAFTRGLIHHAVGEQELISSLITTLLGRTGPDEKPQLRHEALGSFSVLLVHDYAAISEFVSPVLAALLSNFEDGVADLALSAMGTLYKLITGVPDKTHVRPIMVNIVLRCKAKFEQAHPGMRAAAFAIFGALVEMARQGNLDLVTVEQQVHLHLITFVLHTVDPDGDAEGASKEALKSGLLYLGERAGDANGGATIAAVANNDVASGLDDLLDAFAKMWIAVFPGRVNDLFMACIAFFDSPVAVLRAAAAALCGYLFKALPADDLGRTNADSVCGALIALTKEAREKNEKVRTRAAKALGMLPVV